MKKDNKARGALTVDACPGFFVGAKTEGPKAESLLEFLRRGLGS